MVSKDGHKNGTYLPTWARYSEVEAGGTAFMIGHTTTIPKIVFIQVLCLQPEAVSFSQRDRETNFKLL